MLKCTILFYNSLRFLQVNISQILLFLIIFVSTVISVILSHLILWNYAIANSQFYFDTFLGILSIFIMEINAVITIFIICLYCQLNYIASTIMLKFSLFCFTTLDQINAQLNGFTYNSADSVLGWIKNKARFRQFIRNHTRILILILNFDKIMGTLLVGFICINIPLNSYLMMAVISNKYNYQTLFFIFPFLVQQYIVNVGFHYLGVYFTKKLHECCKKLFRLVNTVKLTPYQNVSEGIKLSLYIMRFSTERQYGISYGGISLIKAQTFLEVRKMVLKLNINQQIKIQFWIYYSQFMMYWYRNIIFDIRY